MEKKKYQNKLLFKKILDYHLELKNNEIWKIILYHQIDTLTFLYKRNSIQKGIQRLNDEKILFGQLFGLFHQILIDRLIFFR